MLTTILAAILVLGVLIFVHELGHFLTAKLVDIEVPRFSIGFGPKIFGFRRGETEYVISALPLGGYVKMAGMEEMESIEGGSAEDQPRVATRFPRPRDFESKSLPARTLVISAGVIMNLIFAVFAFSVVGVIWGVPTLPEPVVGNIREEELPAGTTALMSVPRMARITAVGNDAIDNFEDLQLTITTARSGPTEVHFANSPSITIEIPSSDSAKLGLIRAIEPVTISPPLIDAVSEGDPADVAGVKSGDRVLVAAGQPVETWQDLAAAIESSTEGVLPLVVLRDNDTLAITVTPEIRELPNGIRAARIGVGGRTEQLSVPRERLGVLPAFVYGVTETWRWVTLTFDFLGGMLTGRLSPRQMGGPIMITQISGEAARAGGEALLNFMALLSVNLAVLNLLPIPVLDGGHLMFLLIEAVRRRPLSLEQRLRWTKVGFVVILALMVFAIGNDLVRWIGI